MDEKGTNQGMGSDGENLYIIWYEPGNNKIEEYSLDGKYGNTIGHISERFHKQFSRKMSYKDMVQYIHEHETSKYTNHVFTFTFTKTGGMKAYA